MGRISPVQDLKTFHPRHHRGEIAILLAPVCGVFRPHVSPPESGVRPILQRRQGFGRQVGPRVVIWGRFGGR